MTKEGFLDGVKLNAIDDIKAAYFKSEHGHGSDRINIKELNNRLTKLGKLAQLQGIAPQDFEELAKVTLPDVADRIHLGVKGGKFEKKKGEHVPRGGHAFEAQARRKAA